MSETRYGESSSSHSHPYLPHVWSCALRPCVDAGKVPVRCRRLMHYAFHDAQRVLQGSELLSPLESSPGLSLRSAPLDTPFVRFVPRHRLSHLSQTGADGATVQVHYNFACLFPPSEAAVTKRGSSMPQLLIIGTRLRPANDECPLLRFITSKTKKKNPPLNISNRCQPTAPFHFSAHQTWQLLA